jgi:putative PIN family toxin of toxin-antitoxin system
MVRVVLDTNIVVSACLRLEGAPARIVELALLGAFTICVSRDVLLEYHQVLARPKFSRQLERINVLLEGIEEVAVTVTAGWKVEISTDDDDNRLLECADAAKADFLVTGNLKHFPKLSGETRVVSQREFLSELGY